MKEIWIDFNGYQVSNFGKVKNRINDDLKKMCLNSANYHFVVLNYLPKPKMHFVHRLVAYLFIDNPENKPCVNHIDGNKLNNHVSNLEWCTHKENTRHAIDTGLFTFKCGGDSKSSKLTNDQVREIYAMVEKGVPNKEIYDKFPITQPHLSKLKKGIYFKNIPKPKLPDSLQTKILNKKDEILPLIKSGRSFLSLEKEFGFCRKSIKKYLHDDIV